MIFQSKITNLSRKGDTTKKTINKTITIGAAIIATAILAPATFARDHHEPPRPGNGIRLAADIVNLVRAVIDPRPAPVIVERIPEYSYLYYEGDYIPYYEGWIFVDDLWHWAGAGHRPLRPPEWTPPPRHRDRKPHKVIVIPEHRPGHGPAPALYHEGKRPEPPRTLIVRPERKETVVRTERKEKEKVTAQPERKEKEKTTAQPERKEKEKVTVQPERKEKEKVTVQPERRNVTPPKKGR